MFNNTESSTVCIDSEILRNKVYLLDLICEGFISVGLVLKERIPSIHTKGPFGELGSCFVWNTRYVSVGDTSDTRQTGDKHWDEKCPVPVRLELDTEVSPHILYIFAAGKQALPIITNIPTNVCFAFGCYEADTDLTHSVEVKQLQIQTGKAKGDSAKGKIYAWQD